MFQSKYTIIMIILLLVCSSAIIAGGAYGIGSNALTPTSDIYQKSDLISRIGIGLTVFFTISLIILVLMYTPAVEFEIPPN